jgi:hypothetical protein
MATERFPKSVIEAADAAKILGVRAGDTHKFTGVWVVVHAGRVFVRSWGDKPTGWYRAFLAEPEGTMQLGPKGKELPVRAHTVRGERLLDAIDDAYAAKYDTKASLKWVEGFREPERRAHTLELRPR